MFYELAIQYYFHKTEIWAYVAPAFSKHKHASQTPAPDYYFSFLQVGTSVDGSVDKICTHTHIELLFRE